MDLTSKAVGVIDLGTHTARLLVGSMRGSRLEVIANAMRFSRLGEGLGPLNMLSMDAQRRTHSAVRELREVAQAYGCQRLHLIATSACRRASNGASLLTALEREHGVEALLLSGDREAELAFFAASAEFPQRTKLIVIDIGGGSTEVVHRPAVGGTHVSHSLNIGSVITRREHFTTFPPPTEALDAFRATVEEAIRSSAIEPADADAYPVGLAGTPKCLAALSLGARRLGDVPSGFMLSVDDVDRWTETLSRLSLEDTLALSPAVLNERAHLITAGCLILSTLMHALQLPAVHIGHWGIRHGWLMQHAPRDSC